jgi:hypothetical protein
MRRRLFGFRGIGRIKVRYLANALAEVPGFASTPCAKCCQNSSGVRTTTGKTAPHTDDRDWFRRIDRCNRLRFALSWSVVEITNQRPHRRIVRTTMSPAEADRTVAQNDCVTQPPSMNRPQFAERAILLDGRVARQTQDVNDSGSDEFVHVLRRLLSAPTGANSRRRSRSSRHLTQERSTGRDSFSSPRKARPLEADPIGSPSPGSRQFSRGYHLDPAAAHSV